ncbi:MAG: hypothetical protein KDA69_12305 [Planctomycetaceae bacterium]|nr:hypothetical protein [Planctomycetaceae bacterium]MCA9045099.1 hypothetical protein [Planctomycetaceae bacterium]
MSSETQYTYPCPLCGNSREELEATCKHCGWSPYHDPVGKPKENAPQSEPYSKSTAVFAGVLTILPWFYGFFFFAVVLWGLASSHGQPPVAMFAILFMSHICMMMLSLGLIVFYMIHLFSTDFVPKDQKPLWAVLLLVGGLLAMPIYWFFYIWKPATE